MKKFMSLAATVAVTGLLCTVGLFSTSVLAQVVNVDAKATGEFGGHPGVSVPIVLDMVPGFVFSGPGTIRITASGTVDLNQVLPRFQNVTPDGLGLSVRVTDLGGANNYLPLEETLVDALGTGALPPNFSGGGALMGAFVPQAIVDTPGFLAKDEDFPNGGISSDSLFFIGSGPFNFTATIPGTLFLGINDARATNNSGSFEVAISTVGAGSVLKKNITIGAAIIGDNVTLNKNIVAGDGFEVGDGTIVNQGADFGDNVVLGQNVTIGRFCLIGSIPGIGVDIGDNTTIGQRCDIGDDVTIGINVVMGRDVTVASGQVIPNGSVIPAGAMIP